MTEYIQGTRPRGPRPKESIPNLSYLQETREAVTARQDLEKAAWKKKAPCLEDPAFTADEQMTDREAQMKCAPCPVFDKCEIYRKLAKPAWGTWAGKVSRGLEKAMEEGE